MARPHPWNNPYVIGRDGDRQTCLARYARDLLLTIANDPAFWRAMSYIDGIEKQADAEHKAVHG